MIFGPDKLWADIDDAIFHLIVTLALIRLG